MIKHWKLKFCDKNILYINYKEIHFESLDVPSL